MAVSNSRIIVQCDWDQVLRHKGGKVWVAFREPGKKSVYGEIKSDGLQSNGEFKTTVTEGFSVESTHRKHLTLSYRDGKENVRQCRFLAPDSILSKIHNSKKNVVCLDVTPGGLGVSCDVEGKLKIWVTETGEVRRDLTGHYGDVYCCRFFPSGIVVLSGGADTLVKIWSAEDGQCATTLAGHKAGVMDLAIVERGRNVVSVSRDGTAKLWDCGRTSCLATFDDIEGGVINGCCIGVPSNDLDLGSPDLPPDEREILTEGKLLLLACENKMLKAFGLHSRKKVFEVACSGAVNCCSLLSDNLAICGTDDSYINIIDVRNTSSFVASFHETRSAILSLQPYKQGCFVSTGDGSCFYLDKDLTNSLELTGPDCDPVYRVATDGRSAFACCRDGSIRSYHMQTLL